VTLKRISIPSPNYSSRGGTKVRLVVIHTAQGASTIESLGAYFQGDVGVSSHVGIDDTPGTIATYVQRGNKAWTQANANPYSVAAETCGWAEWTGSEWAQHQTMVDNTAAWVAEECAAFGIPIRRLNASQAQGGEAGVTDHAALGAAGGGHWDVGSGFPMDEVIAKAKGQGSSSPPPPANGGKGPAFPYPSTDYLGQPSPDPHCHSGYYGGIDTESVRTWQKQMRDKRHWNISVDGQYGPQSEKCCRQLQANKGWTVDGLVGPETWAGTWNAPIGG